MTKVCHITTVHKVFDARIFHKEAKSLKKTGYDVSLIARHKKNETVEGVKVIALPKAKNRLSRIISLSKNAYKLALLEGADIYVSFTSPAAETANLPIVADLKKKIVMGTTGFTEVQMEKIKSVVSLKVPAVF